MPGWVLRRVRLWEEFFGEYIFCNYRRWVYRANVMGMRAWFPVCPLRVLAAPMAERGARWLSCLRWSVLVCSLGVATAVSARCTLATLLGEHPMWEQIELLDFYEYERWPLLQEVVYFDDEGFPERHNTAWMGLRRGVSICSSHWNELRYQLVEQIERVGRYLFTYQCISRECRTPLEPVMVQYRAVRQSILGRYWAHRREAWEEHIWEASFYQQHGRPHWDRARHWPDFWYPAVV